LRYGVHSLAAVKLSTNESNTLQKKTHIQASFDKRNLCIFFVENFFSSGATQYPGPIMPVIMPNRDGLAHAVLSRRAAPRSSSVTVLAPRDHGPVSPMRTGAPKKV